MPLLILKTMPEVRQLQQTILDSYDRDFSKHAPIAEVLGFV